MSDDCNRQLTFERLLRGVRSAILGQYQDYPEAIRCLQIVTIVVFTTTWPIGKSSRLPSSEYNIESLAMFE